MSERLRALEARFAINDLVSDYCHGIDKRDAERFAAIWHEDAAWIVGEPFGEFRGRKAISASLAAAVWPALPTTHHWTTNLVVEVTGDRGKGECDVWCAATDEAGTRLMIAASYADTFACRSGVWRIECRVVQTHFAVPLTCAEDS